MRRAATRILVAAGVAYAAQETARVARWVRRWDADDELRSIDAELARWFLDDGILAEERTGTAEILRVRRLAAVERLERFGGRDPHPSFFRDVPQRGQMDWWQWRALASALDALIVHALDNEAGWTISSVASVEALQSYLRSGRESAWRGVG